MGRIDDPSEIEMVSEIAVIQDQFALYKSELSVRKEDSWDYLRIYRSITLPKVQVRKLTQEDSLYQLNTIEIADNSVHSEGLQVHYYFLFEIAHACHICQNCRAMTRFLCCCIFQNTCGILPLDFKSPITGDETADRI